MRQGEPRRASAALGNFSAGSDDFIEAAIRQAVHARPRPMPTLPEGYVDSRRAGEIMHGKPLQDRGQQEALEMRALVSRRHDSEAATVIQRNRGALAGLLWANIELAKRAGTPLHAELAAELATLAVKTWGAIGFPGDVVSCRRFVDGWTSPEDSLRAYRDQQDRRDGGDGWAA